MQNYIKTIINAIKTWTDSKIENSKADWNQNDPNADNYVKNRTHWTDDDGNTHKLDPKYLDIPDNLATTDDVQDAIDVANEAYQVADNKMDATNPVGTGSFSMNRKAGTTVGNYSHAEGYETAASGNYSHAEGCGTFAGGRSRYVNGEYNTGQHVYEDYHTTASDILFRNDANFYYSTEYDFDSETGIYTLINPKLISASGINTSSVQNQLLGVYFIGNSSLTPDAITGTRLYIPIKNSTYSSTVSIYNNYNRKISRVACQHSLITQSERGKYVHIVGNGTSDTERSNAHTLDWEGNAWYSGDVYVGSTSGTNKDEGSKKLATEEYVNTVRVQDRLLLTDLSNGLIYRIQMQDGNLTSTVSIEDSLMDFVYTINDDNTYTITDWKGTHHGQPSTEMIIPNLPNIIV